MQSQDKYALLRPLLKKLGLSSDAVEDILDRIGFFLADKIQNPFDLMQYPYAVRDDYFSPVEQSFYLVLKSILPTGVLAFPKVALGDLFVARPNDASKVRGYTSKMDRKHVDFLLCDAKNLRPIAGVQLEDQSMLKPRDEFIANTFLAARLPLIWILAKPSYTAAELNLLLQPYLVGTPQNMPQTTPPVAPQPAPQPAPPPAPNPAQAYPKQPLRCPKCGSEMILRTAISGENQVDQYWGCSRYPQCKGQLKYDPKTDF